jgi:hypothetical protein
MAITTSQTIDVAELVRMFGPLVGCVVGLLVALFVGLMLVKAIARRGRPLAVNYRATELLSRGELAFFAPLLRAVPETHRVFVKVRLSDLARPIVPKERFLSELNRISSKHVDFVLFDRRTGHVPAVIELDDASHQRPDRQRRDAQVDHVLRSAGIAVMHIRAQAAYDTAELQRSIADTLSHSPPPRL